MPDIERHFRPLNNDEILDAFDRQRFTKVIQYSLTALGSCFLAGSIFLEKIEAQLGCQLIGTGFCAGAMMANHRAQRQQDEIDTWSTALRQNRMSRLYNQTVTKPEPVAEKEPAPQARAKFFDLNDFSRRDDYPAIIVAGIQGSGKTTIARYLAAITGAEKTVYISPHVRPNDEVKNYDLVYGGFASVGGDIHVNKFNPVNDLFISEDGKTIELESAQQWPPEPHASVFAVLQSLLGEAGKRMQEYSLGIKGEADFEPLDVFLDEAVSLTGYYTQGAYKKITSDWWKNFMAYMLTEPRKIRIRLWVLTQEGTVDALGLQGYGNLKNATPWIRLTVLGEEHAKAALKTQPLEAEVYLQQNKTAPRSVAWVTAGGFEGPAVVPSREVQMKAITDNRPQVQTPQVQPTTQTQPQAHPELVDSLLTLLSNEEVKVKGELTRNRARQLLGNRHTVDEIQTAFHQLEALGKGRLTAKKGGGCIFVLDT